MGWETGWKTIRRRVFVRDKHRCRRCGNGYKLTCHHIRPRDDGGDNSLGNLITLCMWCHDTVEIEGWRTIADITVDDSFEIAPDEVISDDWHTWVYGSGRNANHVLMNQSDGLVFVDPDFPIPEHPWFLEDTILQKWYQTDFLSIILALPENLLGAD